MYEPTAGAHNPVPATPLCSYHATVFTQTSLLFAQFSREFLILDKSLGRTARPTQNLKRQFRTQGYFVNYLSYCCTVKILIFVSYESQSKVGDFADPTHAYQNIASGKISMNDLAMVSKTVIIIIIIINSIFIIIFLFIITGYIVKPS